MYDDRDAYLCGEYIARECAKPVPTGMVRVILDDGQGGCYAEIVTPERYLEIRREEEARWDAIEAARAEEEAIEARRRAFRDEPDDFVYHDYHWE